MKIESYIDGERRLVLTLDGKSVSCLEVLWLVKGILECEIFNKPQYADGKIWKEAVNRVLNREKPERVVESLKGYRRRKW